MVRADSGARMRSNFDGKQFDGANPAELAKRCVPNSTMGRADIVHLQQCCGMTNVVDGERGREGFDEVVFGISATGSADVVSLACAPAGLSP